MKEEEMSPAVVIANLIAMIKVTQTLLIKADINTVFFINCFCYHGSQSSEASLSENK